MTEATGKGLLSYDVAHEVLCLICMQTFSSKIFSKFILLENCFVKFSLIFLY